MATQEQIIQELLNREEELSPDQVARFEAFLETQPAPEGFEPEGKSVGGFLGNILPSAGRLVSDIGTAIAHPIDTLRGIGGLIPPGGVSGVGRGMAGQHTTPEQEALVNFIRDRYGSPEALGSTVYEDPVGFMADLSAVLGGGAGALRAGASVAPKVGGLSRAADIVGKTGRAIDPVRQTARVGAAVAKPPLKIAYKFGEAGVGVATGAGADAVRVAVVQGTDRFKAAMRGQRNLPDIVQDVRAAVQELRVKRGQAYRARMRELGDVGKPLDLAPVRRLVDEKLADFRVRRRPATGPVPGDTAGDLIVLDEAGAKRFDFSSSAIGDKAQREVARAVDLVENWTDTSVLGVDALKRRLADFYSDSSQARAFIASLEKEVSKTLEKVPGYRKMTKDYSAASEVINILDKEFSLSGTPGDTVRKLTNALNQNNNYRTTLLEALDEAGGTRLLEEVGGAAFQSTTPRGIMRPLAGGSLIYSVGQGSLESIPALALTSPRAMGELLTAISAVRRGAAAVGRNVPGLPGAMVYRPLTIDLEDPETAINVERNRRAIDGSL